MSTLSICVKSSVKPLSTSHTQNNYYSSFFSQLFPTDKFTEYRGVDKQVYRASLTRHGATRVRLPHSVHVRAFVVHCKDLLYKRHNGNYLDTADAPPVKTVSTVA